MSDEIRKRLFDCEDSFTERKPEKAKRDELRKTIVGFANSTPLGRKSILFVGISDQGKVLGVSNSDSKQKEIQQICETDCYPPIISQPEVLEHEGNKIVAVVIPHSENGPHFSGPAYVRKGSQTNKASSEMFAELIASRNDKARKILSSKGTNIPIRWRSASDFYYESICFLESCDAHSLSFKEDDYFGAVPLCDVEVISGKLEPTLVIKPPWTEAEHLKKIVWRWRYLSSTGQRGMVIINDNYLISQLLANPEKVLSAVAAEVDGTMDICLKSLLVHLRFEIKKRTKPISKIQKRRYIEALFGKAMHGKSPSSPSCIISAITDSVAEVATSLGEAKESILALQQNFSKTVSFDTLWNALMWKIGMT